MRLGAWLGREEAQQPVRLTLASTLYTGPNPDRTRKLCGNCVFWLGAARAECWLHDASVETTAAHVCGYHVYGAPQATAELRRENMQPLDPETSGLELASGGTSCDNCRSFVAEMGGASGRCQALYDLDADMETHPIVDARGCCGAWAPVDSGP